MSVDVTSVTQYTENFIPFELFVLIFIFSMICLILSIIAKKGNIFFSALSAVTTIFLIYSTFFLRWYTTYLPTRVTYTGEDIITSSLVTQITNVNQMFLSVPTLWLLIGLFAFSIASLWMNIAYYTQKTLKEAVKEHKNLDDDGGML